MLIWFSQIKDSKFNSNILFNWQIHIDSFIDFSSDFINTLLKLGCLQNNCIG